jgi:predicted dehydrogenase
MTPLDRRTFIRRGTLAAGALSSLAIRTKNSSAAVGANDEVVLAVMGTNGRGSGLIHDFGQVRGVRVAYVCDPDTRAIDKGIKTVEKLGTDVALPQGISDFRTALDDPAVDALVIAAPDHWHAPATILGCAAGKHVYVEKPASHNGQEGEWMIAAARKYERNVQLGTQRRSSSGICEQLGRLGEGLIGEVRMARGWINSNRPSIGHGKEAVVPDYLDYDLWQGPAPRQAYRDNVIHYHWHWFWDWGTGEMGNNGIHALDVCRWGLGVDVPERVTCAGGKYFFDDDQQTPDTQIATFDFGDKLINWEHRTWHQRGFEDQTFGIVFYGDGGSLFIGSNDYQVRDKEDKVSEEGKLDRGDIVHQQNFVDAIRGNGSLNAEIAEGVASTQLCHWGNVAYRSGRTVNIDPATATITDDTEQQQLWTRDYEAGWEPKLNPC